jgi:hypothetical protein
MTVTDFASSYTDYETFVYITNAPDMELSVKKFTMECSDTYSSDVSDFTMGNLFYVFGGKSFVSRFNTITNCNFG